jgi:diguanylate cyclase (GGDEF)-like protein
MGIALRVLLVEDSDVDVFLILRELRRGGYEPLSQQVRTHAELKAALQDVDWDMVITDHQLPGGDFALVLETIQGLGRELPVIIVAGSMGEDQVVAAMKMGAQDYILKDRLRKLVPAVQRELLAAEGRRAQRLAADTIQRLAYHDALTGLVNRNEFDRRLNKALQSAKDEGLFHVLLYLDLDKFKAINDTCGHAAGDQLLSQLSLVLRDKVRSNDTLARLGGDEFGLLLEDCPLSQAEQIANEMRESVNGFRFVWQDKSFSVGVSIGMVAVSPNAHSVSDVLSAADIACYTAKDLGRDRIHLYAHDDTEMRRRHNEMHWVSRVQAALEADRFELYCQEMQRLCEPHAPPRHCEFLLRMRDDDGDIILPKAFIPAAERYGIMAHLDRWVVKAVIGYLAERDRGGHGSVGGRVSFINISGVSLGDADFYDFIRKQITAMAIAPQQLCFEITETAAISNLRQAVNFIKGVRDLGCQFALDDFGAGLSSFSYLKAIPVDYLKIDGRFVRNVAADPLSYAIVQAVNDIGHVAGLHTIAEFVETTEVRDTLCHMGVDMAQGYGIARPQAVAASRLFS